MPLPRAETASLIVIDDEPSRLGGLVALLTGQGFDVQSVASGALAFDAVRESEPDLVLLASRLSGVNSLELCRQLQADEKTLGPLVILYGAVGEAVEKVEGFKAGCADFITQPFAPEEVLARIRTQLRLRDLAVNLEAVGHDRPEGLTPVTRYPRQKIDEKAPADSPRDQLLETLRESEARYRCLFEDSPTPLWEEDLSQVKAYFSELNASGVTDFRSYFENHPEAVTHCAKLVRVLDLNHAALALLGASDKGALSAGLASIFTKESLEVFREVLIALAGGSQRFESEAVQRTLAGEEKRIVLQLGVVPGYEASLGKVLVSTLDVTEIKRAEQGRLYHLRFLENLERVDQAIRQAECLEQMMMDVLDTTLSIFNCDRAWLLYPCDPAAPSFRVSMERTREEYAGAYAMDVDIPVLPEVAEAFRTALKTNGPVPYDPGAGQAVPLGDRFSIQTHVLLAVQPKQGKHWGFGMHQCSYQRVWTAEELSLFHEIGRRVGDCLSILLLVKDLRESQERFDLAVKGSRDGLWDWPDTTRPAIWWSPRVYEMFGFAPGEIIPTKDLLVELVHPDDREKAQGALREHLQGGATPYDEEFRIRSRTGGYLWVWARGQSLRDAAGQSRRMSGSFQDITERKRAEEELKKHRDHLEELVAQRTAKLKSSNAKLEAANHELEAFTYTVSHDLRAPLTPIMGYAEYLKDKYSHQLDSQAVAMLSEISTQGEKMLSLMKDLLSLAQVGHLRAPDQPVASEDVCRAVLADLGEEFAGVANLVQIKGALPAVRVPRSLLTQVFANLTGNGLRYAGGGGGPIEIKGERQGSRVSFSVSDHGPGIPPEERLRVFEVFYRGLTESKIPGSGVGLAIVAKIARHFGGSARVEETPGGGCTFTVEFVDSVSENLPADPLG